ncbi:MAG: hypothetical protein OQK51_10340 [Kangiellaceae bacterium]|nr:hypothetical protein [Kangiellaceae bacterium]
MKLFRMTHYISTLNWSVLGMLTAGSCLLGSSQVFINVFMGGVFGLIGLFLFFKSSNVSLLANQLAGYEKEVVIKEKLNKLIFTETLFNILSVLFSSILLTGVISRIWGEGLPIFG